MSSPYIRISDLKILPFPDKIVGKETAFRDPKIEVEIQPKLVKLWDELWAGRPGK